MGIVEKLNDEELRVLRRIGEGHAIFSEYTPIPEFETGIKLYNSGLVDGYDIVTGTVRYTLTAAGTEYLRQHQSA